MIGFYKRKRGFRIGHLEKIHHHYYEFDLGFYVITINF